MVTNEIGEPHLNHYGISFHSGGLYRPTSNESSLDEKELFFLLYSMSDGSQSSEEIFAIMQKQYSIQESSFLDCFRSLSSKKIVSF